MILSFGICGELEVKMYDARPILAKIELPGSDTKSTDALRELKLHEVTLLRQGSLLGAYVVEAFLGAHTPNIRVKPV